MCCFSPSRSAKYSDLCPLLSVDSLVYRHRNESQDGVAAIKIGSDCGMRQIAGSSFELLAEDSVHTSQRRFSSGGIVDGIPVPATELDCPLDSKLPRSNG